MKFNMGPLHLCWFWAVGPFNTWLISSWEKNDCSYKLRNWQNDNFGNFGWNSCHFVRLLILYQHLFSSQLEISRLLNGPTAQNQHRFRGLIVSSLSMILSHDFPDSWFSFFFYLASSGFQLSIPKIVWDNASHFKSLGIFCYICTYPTLPISELSCVKNVRAIAVFGFLIK